MEINWTVIGLIGAFLFCFGALYAIAVRWMSRNHIEGQTAYLVVFGVLVTVLASSLLIGFHAAATVLGCFAASGLPMVIEYVLRVSEARKNDHEQAQSIARNLLQ